MPQAQKSDPFGVYQTAPALFDQGQVVIQGNRGTIKSATMLMILISGFTAGPAVSLYGSPTVSPVTAALWASLALAVYLLAFDTRGFAVLSLIPLILLAGLQALAWLRQNGRAWHWALLVLLSIAAIIGIVLRVYASQKAADINNGPLQFSFQNKFLEAITTSVWQHGYWLPALGWLLLILVLGMIFGGWFNKFGMASQGVLLLGGTYILVFLFLSFLMGADGFVMRPRYGVLLETLSIPVWGVALPWLTNQAASRLQVGCEPEDFFVESHSH